VLLRLVEPLQCAELVALAEVLTQGELMGLNASEGREVRWI
jgi:hypothetical protein